MKNYPIPAPAEDPRFSMGLILEVAKLLGERGFPKIDDGSDLVQLQQALFGFLYAPKEGTSASMTRTPSEQERDARAKLETIVASLTMQELTRLVIIGRTLRDESTMVLTPSERARDARAELETIVASLRVDELARLVELGRRLVEETIAG